MRKLTLLFTSLLLACSAASNSNEASDETQDEGEAALSNPNYGYFVAQRDLRKCAYPMCGGYFVHRVNASKTRCIDGSYQDSCYVTGIDLSKLMLTENDLDYGKAIFRGAIEKTEINGKTWGTFAGGEAWANETGSDALGDVWRVEDNGIRCIKAPCPSISADKLNTSAVRQVTDMDYSGANATQKQIDGANDSIFSESLLVTGTIAATKDGGHRMMTTAFFHSKTGVRLCGSKGLAQCGKDEFCSFTAKANCGRADAPGVCTVKPQICYQLYKPVCGCNGQTYSNDCYAHGAGVSVDHDGACQ